MLGPVITAIRSLSLFRYRSFGMKRVFRNLLDHRMPAGRDAHLAIGRKRRPRVAVLRRHLGQRRRDIQFRDGRRRGFDPLRMARGQLPHFREDPLLQREDLLFGVQHLALVILQLRRGEALRVHQRLLALVIRRREMQIGVRDLDVIAEDVVEPDLQRLNAGARALPRFDLRDVLTPVLAAGRAVRPVRRCSRRESCRHRPD